MRDEGPRYDPHGRRDRHGDGRPCRAPPEGVSSRGWAGRYARRSRAKILANISHRNIVTIFDLDYYEESPYIVMELLQGRDLYEAMRETPSMTLGKRIDVVRQALVGLGRAHRVGVVHRDIKPKNLFVTSDEEVKILDFGVARIDGASKTANKILGSLHYMSPEQWRSSPLDGRSDLFSIGVTLYELIAEVPPFVGDDPVATMYKTLLEEADLTPIRARAPALIPILQKALQKEVTARYQAAAEFASALESVRIEESTLDIVPVLPPPPDEPLQIIAVREKPFVDTGSTPSIAPTIDIPPPPVVTRRQQRDGREASLPQGHASSPRLQVGRSKSSDPMAVDVVRAHRGSHRRFRSSRLVALQQRVRDTHRRSTGAIDDCNSRHRPERDRSELARLIEQIHRDARPPDSSPPLAPVDYALNLCIATALRRAETIDGKLDIPYLRNSLNECAPTGKPPQAPSPIIASVQALLTENAHSRSCPGLEPLHVDGVRGPKTTFALQRYIDCHAKTLSAIERFETLGDYATVGIYLVHER